LNNEGTFRKVSISPQVLILLKNKKVFYLKIKTKMIGTEGARLLREKRVKGRPHRCEDAEEAPRPPAESEYLEWKSNV
jgi:hypothetical protein